MDITRLLQLIIFLANGIVTVHPYNVSPLSSSKDKWQRINVLDQDELHQTFVSIEERLRIVDSIRYGINRLEISIDRINNKMDSLESRLSRLHTQVDALEARGRLQSVMQMKLESISQALISTEMKLEMLPDHVAAKLGASHDRLLLRINSLENTIDSQFTKIQGNQNDFVTKLRNELGSKTTQLTSSMDDIRLKSVQLEDRLNSTFKNQMQHLMNIESKLAKNEEVELLTSRLDGIRYQLNQSDITWAQNDSPRINDNEKDRMVNSLKSELHTEAQKIGNKFGNIYNEASKRLHAIENAVRDHIVETNGTQKELKDKLRQLIRNHKDCEGSKRSIYYGFMDIKLEDIKSYIRMNFANLYDKLEAGNTKIKNLQTALIESCSTNQGLEEFEQRVSVTLDKIHEIFSNKTNKIDKQTNDLMTLMKSHSSQAARTEKIVITLAHEVKQDRKNLHNALTELFGQGDSAFLAIQDMRRDVERVLKRDLTTSRRQSNYTSSTQGNDKVGVNAMDENVNRITTVEVRHPEGIIKLLTDPSPNGTTEGDRKSTRPSTPPSHNMTTILALGRELNVTDRELEILGWTPSVITKDEEDEGDDNEEGEDELNSKSDPEKKDGKSDVKDLPDEFVTHIMLDYVKLLRGQITLQEFLKEANIARTYNTLPEMIKDLEGMDSVPPDFIEELTQYEADKDFDFEELKKPYGADASQDDDVEDYNYDT